MPKKIQTPKNYKTSQNISTPFTRSKKINKPIPKIF